MRPAHGLLLLPLVVYLLVAVVWYEWRVNPLTGDEPHYLLTADSLVRDGDLQVVNNHQIDTPVLREMPPGAVFTESHALNGYSLHGVGLPLLLVPAYALAGVLGAKVCMALLSGLAPLLLYRLARPILGDTRWAIAVAVLLGLSQPYVIASNQIYPDLLAGLIILYLLGHAAEPSPQGFYHEAPAGRTSKFGAMARAGIIYHEAHEAHEDRTVTPPQTVAWWRSGLLLAFLPWLHLKLTLPAIILWGFYVWRLVRRQKGAHEGHIHLIWPLVASLLGLAAYHAVAFGSIFGPYQPGDATTDVSHISMILLGLHLDRLQGLFVLAPIYLLGVFGLALFAAADGPLALLTGLLYLAVMLPNALHTNWYGGVSVIGRFHWTGALLWSLPLLYGLRHLRARGRSALAVGFLIVTGLCQVVVLAKLLIPNAYLYNDPLVSVAGWTESNPYSDFFALTPWQRIQFLPSFRDLTTYLGAPVNWVALGLVVALLLAGRRTLR